MVQITLPDDFKEFLRLLGARGVEYLLVGGYARGLMPVQKFRSLDEAQQALRGDPRDPAYLRRVAWLWRLGSQLAPRRYPRGVHQYRSMDEANHARESWERAAAITARPGPGRG